MFYVHKIEKKIVISVKEPKEGYDASFDTFEEAKKFRQKRIDREKSKGKNERKL